MLEICGNLAHLYIYQNVREQNETIFLILGRKIVAWKPRSSQATHQLADIFSKFAHLGPRHCSFLPSRIDHLLSRPP